MPIICFTFLSKWDIYTVDIADSPIIYVYESGCHEIKSGIKKQCETSSSRRGGITGLYAHRKAIYIYSDA